MFYNCTLMDAFPFQQLKMIRTVVIVKEQNRIHCMVFTTSVKDTIYGVITPILLIVPQMIAEIIGDKCHF